MIIVKPSVELLFITPNAASLIETAARTCYKSESKGKPEEFCEKLIKAGHLAMIEHASATFKIVTDRGISHELVRHRLCSFAQESTRWISYGRGKFGSAITVIEPTALYTPHLRRIWKESCENSEAIYMRMLSKGVDPQHARSVLPTCLKTELVITANLRQWLTILKIRSDLTAHPDVRLLMGKIAEILEKEVIWLFSAQK